MKPTKPNSHHPVTQLDSTHVISSASLPGREGKCPVFVI
jgi:hypothetical protein